MPAIKSSIIETTLLFMSVFQNSEKNIRKVGTPEVLGDKKTD
jgi:hypothetical protein